MRPDRIRTVGIGLALLASAGALPVLQRTLPTSPALPRHAPWLFAFFLPTAALVTETLLRQVARWDPLRRNYARFQGTYSLILNAVVLFFLAVHLVLLATLLGGADRVGRAPALLLGLLLLVVGNVLPRVRPNLAIGVRTPWTLHDERSWARTHRVGGYALVVLGIMVLGCAAWAPVWMGRVAGIGTFLTAAALVAVSYWARGGSRPHPPSDGPLRELGGGSTGTGAGGGPDGASVMRCGVVVATLLVTVGTALCAAADPPDFSGEWVLNTAQSRLTIPGVRSGTVSIVHREPLLHFSRTFVTQDGPEEASYELTTDGQQKTTESGRTTRRSRLFWEAEELVLDEHIALGDRTATNVVRYRLAKAGATLIARESFRGPRLQYHNVWVFDRR